jgi:hypothetical protein
LSASEYSAHLEWCGTTAKAYLQQQQELTIHNLHPDVGKRRQQNMLDSDHVNDAEFYNHDASGENAARKSLVC